MHENISARFLHGEEGLLLRQLVWDKGAGRQRASGARFFTLPPVFLQPFLALRARNHARRDRNRGKKVNC